MAEQDSLEFTEFELHGPLWQKLYARALEPSPYQEDLHAWLDAPETREYLCRLDPAGAALYRILHGFTAAGRACGDEEANWMSCREAFAEAFAQHSAAELEQAWRQVWVLLPETFAAWWSAGLERGLDLFLQTALGRALEAHAADLAAALAEYVTQLSRPAENEREAWKNACQQALQAFLLYLGGQLQHRPPTLAALNVDTWLVANLAPAVKYPAPLWHLLWLKLQDTLEPLLEAPLRPALYRWCAHLEASAELLPTTQQAPFPPGEGLGRGGQDEHHTELTPTPPPLPEGEETDSQQARDWRELVGGLLGIAMLADEAPLPARLLAERLLLSSPVFEHTTAPAWLARQNTLLEAVAGSLPHELVGRLAHLLIHIDTILPRLPLALEGEGWSAADVFTLLQPSAPHAADNWRLQLWLDLAEHDSSGVGLQDLLIARLLHWSIPAPEQLRAQAELYRAAEAVALPDTVTAGADEPLPASVRDTLRLLLRLSALHYTWQADKLRMPLYRYMAQLHAAGLSSAQSVALVQSVADTIAARHGAEHTLARRWRDLLPLASAAAVGHTLLHEREQVATRVLEQIKPALPAVKLKSWLYDLHRTMRYLGIQTAALAPQEAPAQWYWRRCGRFLGASTRKATAVFLEQFATALDQALAPLDTASLQQLVHDLNTLCDTPYWRQDPVYSLAPARDAPSFTPLPVQGPVWRQVFEVPRPVPEIMQEEALLEMPLMPGFPAQLEGAFSAWVQGLAGPGDPEAARQAALEHFARTLDTHSAEALRAAWLELLDMLPAHVPGLFSAWWIEAFHDGPQLIAQAALGRHLEEYGEQLAAAVAAYLQELGVPSLENNAECCCEQTRWLVQLGTLLRRQPPTLAALDATRYLIECRALPYTRHTWHLLWLKLQDLLLKQVSPAVRPAVYRWIAQLDGIAGHLPEIREFSQLLLHSAEPLFSTQRAQEKAWRECFAGLLASAVTPAHLPVPGAALAQRLVLSSPVWEGQAAFTWQQHWHTWQQELLDGLLGQDLEHALNRSQTLVSALLSKLPRCNELSELCGFDAAAMVCPDLPGIQRLWQYSVWLRGEEDQQWEPTPEDLSVTQTTGWRMPDPVSLAQAVIRYRATLDLPMELTAYVKNGGLLARSESVAAQASDLHALRLLLRLLALYSTFGNETAAITEILGEVLESLAHYNLPVQNALLEALADAVGERHGARHGLTQACRELLQNTAPAHTAATRLLRDHSPLAHMVREHSNSDALSQDDLGMLLHHLGLVGRGLYRREDLSEWYWLRCGVFLREDARTRLEAMLDKAAKALSKSFSGAELKVLEAYFQTLAQGVRTWPPAEASGPRLLIGEEEV